MVLKVSTLQEFHRQVLEAPVPTLALFYAEWCPFCVSFQPLFREQQARSGQSLRFVEVDISDEENTLWEEYSVEIVPTLICFDGGEVRARADGVAGRGLRAGDLRAIAATPAP